MFPEPAGGSPTTRPHAPAPAPAPPRWYSRVRGAPEIFGELPAACLAEEVSVPGPGRVRGLVVFGGNPARSIPDSTAVEDALAGLDALICIDPYLNETARDATRPSLLGTRTVTETLPNGRTTEKRVLWISDEIAPLIREAERKELADLPQPLDGGVR